MGLHRALLIGASDYEMRGIQPLPFIAGDLTRLGAILTNHGFNDVQVLARRSGGKQISANYINARVIGFLRRARRGDTAFIVLSGHGVHARGRDYLVPEDIDEDVHPFESGCVPIDWRQHLDETPADHVVFLIDACREGIEQDSMSVAGVREWGQQQISAALRRKVAYVYGCSPAQLSLFVRPHEVVQDGRDHGTRSGESFSIFSRSIADVVLSHPKGEPLSLGAFKETVQDRVTELHRAYKKKGDPQILRIVTDIPTDDFFFLPHTAPVRSPQQPPWVGSGDVATMSISAPPTAHPPRPPVAFGPPATAAAPQTGPPQMPLPPAKPPDTAALALAPARRHLRIRWTRRKVILLSVGLAVFVGGLLGGYQWTQTQYYVGTQGNHVALYQGVNDSVLGISLSKVLRDHPEIELKYLPPYQQKQVQATIAEDSKSQGQSKVDDLAVQASACKKEARRQNGDKQVTLTEDEQKLVSLCGHQ
ncbi:caspase family protein [Streptomyces mirabilis]|uniref:caspase family protein n=1 Tax=Streptomyces mirabilis TaxID=68239 RepID=UPI003648069D